MKLIFIESFLSCPPMLFWNLSCSHLFWFHRTLLHFVLFIESIFFTLIILLRSLIPVNSKLILCKCTRRSLSISFLQSGDTFYHYWIMFLLCELSFLNFNRLIESQVRVEKLDTHVIQNLKISCFLLPGLLQHLLSGPRVILDQVPELIAWVVRHFIDPYFSKFLFK